MDKKIKKMLKLARKARGNSYAPYSKFKVGACVLSKKGKYYLGSNVENSSSPEGTCAETGAVAAMVAAGDRHIEAVVIVGPTHKAISPCGGCRQRLAEFASKKVPVYFFDDEGNMKSMTVSELLPESFKV